MRILSSIFALVVSTLLTGCGEEPERDRKPFEAQQFARVQILNAFSATDSAIRAAAHSSAIIDSIDDDRGGGSSESGVERMRGWSIHVRPSATPDERAELLRFLKELSGAYDDLNSSKFGDVADFDFTYAVAEQAERIDVKATGTYRTK